MARQVAPIVIERCFAPPSEAAEAALARAMELVLAQARRIEQEEAIRPTNREVGATASREKLP